MFSVFSVAVRDPEDSPFPRTYTGLPIKGPNPWSCEVHSCVWRVVLLHSPYMLRLIKSCVLYIFLKLRLKMIIPFSKFYMLFVNIPQILSYISVSIVFLQSLLRGFPPSTDAPSENKASSRLCSPAVIAWERPNLGYKYPTLNLYLVWVRLWREAQFCQRRWVCCVILV